MSTTTMSLATTGFTADLEEGDHHAQLARYADDAEVSIVNWGQPIVPARTLAGKLAIGHWIAESGMHHQSVRVVYHVERENDVTVIAECRQYDGTIGVYSSTAQLEDGLIVRQHVVLL